MVGLLNPEALALPSPAGEGVVTDLFIICIASACLGTACFLFGVWIGRGEPVKKNGEKSGQGGGL